MGEIKDINDQPDFSNSVPPTIDQVEQDKLDVLIATFRASEAQVDDDMATVSQSINAIVDWTAVAEHVMQLVQPLIGNYLAKQGVPKERHPSKLQTALPQLLGIVTAAPKDRAGLVGSLLTSLV